MYFFPIIFTCPSVENKTDLSPTPENQLHKIDYRRFSMVDKRHFLSFSTLFSFFDFSL